jgi:hypothetical protein
MCAQLKPEDLGFEPTPEMLQQGYSRLSEQAVDHAQQLREWRQRRGIRQYSAEAERAAQVILGNDWLVPHLPETDQQVAAAAAAVAAQHVQQPGIEEQPEFQQRLAELDEVMLAARAAHVDGAQMWAENALEVARRNPAMQAQEQFFQQLMAEDAAMALAPGGRPPPLSAELEHELTYRGCSR